MKGLHDPEPHEDAASAHQRAVQRAADAAIEVGATVAKAQEVAELERSIIAALLGQVEGVGNVTMDRLERAEITRLALFGGVKPGDMSTAAGIDAALAETIVGQFAQYFTLFEGVSLLSMRDELRQALLEATTELQNLNEVFEQARVRADRESKRRERDARKQREKAVLRITVLLARLGDLAFMEKWSRAPFAKKVDMLQQELHPAAWSQ